MVSVWRWWWFFHHSPVPVCSSGSGFVLICRRMWFSSPSTQDNADGGCLAEWVGRRFQVTFQDSFQLLRAWETNVYYSPALLLQPPLLPPLKHTFNNVQLPKACLSLGSCAKSEACEWIWCRLERSEWFCNLPLAASLVSEGSSLIRRRHVSTRDCNQPFSLSRRMGLSSHRLSKVTKWQPWISKFSWWFMPTLTPLLKRNNFYKD